jgi:hypothetical protein
LCRFMAWKGISCGYRYKALFGENAKSSHCSFIEVKIFCRATRHVTLRRVHLPLLLLNRRGGCRVRVRGLQAATPPRFTEAIFPSPPSTKPPSTTCAISPSCPLSATSCKYWSLPAAPLCTSGTARGERQSDKMNGKRWKCRQRNSRERERGDVCFRVKSCKAARGE